MRRALLPLVLLFGCDRDELVCEEGQHAVDGVCVADLPPTVRYPDSGGADSGGADSGGADSGGADSAQP